ncbi:MAG: dihydropteroate synthase, partial [Thermoplasmatales archaeon]|nr:dihydropteroate synthase [Thermoplasmatales archaeon]
MIIQEIGKRTIIMGILNVTPDSFSDGGKFFSVDDAVKQAVRMVEEGADIIDIGGESTRPDSNAISLDEEMNRVLPVAEELVKKIKIPISVDTYKSEIAKKSLDLGASMINDISALRGDKKLANVVAGYDVPICLMHMKGNPHNMQKNPDYDDIVFEIKSFLKERAEYAMFNDIKEENIIVDPGIGFGKRTGRGVEDNCVILNRLSELKSLGYPILVGPSRKTFIGNVCGGK